MINLTTKSHRTDSRDSALDHIPKNLFPTKTPYSKDPTGGRDPKLCNSSSTNLILAQNYVPML